MNKFGVKKRKWFGRLGTTYGIIILLFVIWMVFFDTNSFFIHKELNDDIKALEENKEFYEKEIKEDNSFIQKMQDSNEVEKFAREKYYLKKENEEIFIIESNDSVKIKESE